MVVSGDMKRLLLDLPGLLVETMPEDAPRQFVALHA
jgi:hypothetical protein